MKEPTYFVITCDGGPRITQETRASLLERLDPREHDLVATKAMSFISDGDLNYWGETFVIIKGEIVTPKAKEIVTRFEI